MVLSPRSFEAEVHTVTMTAPTDVSFVASLFDMGIVDPSHVVAVMAQTENGDEARLAATSALLELLSKRLRLSIEEVDKRVPMLMIGGTAALMCPHITLFTNRPTTSTGAKGLERLVIGAATTRELLPEELGTVVELDEVTRTVHRALAQAGITDTSQVKSVQLKTPALTSQALLDAADGGASLCHPEPAGVNAMARGAAALGAAVAVGEVDRRKLDSSQIGVDSALHTRIAFASSGAEQKSVRVVVLGSVDGAPGRLVIANGVMAHQLDVHGAHRVFEAAGMSLVAGVISMPDRPRLKAVFVKAGGDGVDSVQGRRHTMHTGMGAGFSGNQAKAAAHAILSAVVGDTLVLANAGAEHQGLPGTNLLCVIAAAKQTGVEGAA